jgi:hypothetical protein
MTTEPNTSWCRKQRAFCTSKKIPQYCGLEESVAECSVSHIQIPIKNQQLSERRFPVKIHWFLS